MIIRIVKMEFHPENIESFLTLFNRKKYSIEGFKGCSHLKLLRDKNHPNTFFTYSYWQDEKALESYRRSELFNSVWAKTKVLFSAKPKAWSTEEV